MIWLSTLPLGLLIVGWLAATALVAMVSRLTVRALIPEPQRDGAFAIAAALMSPLGAGFAILAALTLASEAASFVSAESIVSSEAGDAARMAWAATSPGVDPAPLHATLSHYLQATRTFEWHGSEVAEQNDAQTATTLAGLENAVRNAAVKPGLGTPISTELLTSIDALTADRRARLATASKDLPDLYVISLVVSGCALIANAGALTIRVNRRSVVMIGGLTVVIGLSIALIFALSSPWRGPVVVSGYPLDTVIQDLTSGYFHA